MTDQKILALDLSTSGLGMVAIGTEWDLQWSRVKAKTLACSLRKATPRERIERLRMLAMDVRTWCIYVGATAVYAEAIPTFGYEMVTLAQLRTAVDLELYRETGLVVQSIQQNTARKLLLGEGNVGQKDRKQRVADALKAQGARFEDCDQSDAFAIANYALHELGAPCFTKLLGERPAKEKRTKRKAAA